MTAHDDAVRLIFDTAVDERLQWRRQAMPRDYYDGRVQGLISALYFLTGEPHEQIRARVEKTADKRPTAPPQRSQRRLCAHADLGGEGMHFLEPGERCTYYDDRGKP